MTIATGILPTVGEIPTDYVHPDRMWARRQAADVQPGMRLRLDDGLGNVREVVVSARPERVRLGKLQVPVLTAAHRHYPDLDPELVLLHARALVKTRTPLEQTAYLDAVDVHNARAAARRGL
ncbi:MAG TPA: hypothetical protein VL551_22555 [Actinospica sp.]|jgi:hypothetical protein|nr:hypothetical protein [Actinospica sp.]